MFCFGISNDEGFQQGLSSCLLHSAMLFKGTCYKNILNISISQFISHCQGALETFKWENQVASHFGVCYGAKLVRGAYLEKESQVAPHMVCENYEETSKSYTR
jgi:hypothetical protein